MTVEISTADHHVRWSLHGGSLQGQLECTASADAACRLACEHGWDCTDGEGLGTMFRGPGGPYHVVYDGEDREVHHNLVDGGSCGWVNWINDDDALIPERIVEDIDDLQRTPVWVTWTGDDYELTTKVRRCRVCGCVDDQACAGGCWWVDRDLCSACKSSGVPA